MNWRERLQANGRTKSAYDESTIPAHCQSAGRSLQRHRARHQSAVTMSRQALFLGPLKRSFHCIKACRRPDLSFLARRAPGKAFSRSSLLRELLDAAGPESPIPAIIPAATWDVDTEFSTWISVQLQNSYPGLSQEVRDANGEVVSAAQILMGHQMILPIVDGFDEIPEAQHGKAVEKINRYGSNYPLVLTSRPNEYINAITSVGRGISRASVVEILPLRVEQAEQYLRESTAGTPIDRWDEVFQLLNRSPTGS